MPSTTPPAKRGKSVHRHDDQRINDDAPGDGRHAVQNIGGEADPPVQFCAAVFGKENAAEHADRHADDRGLREQNKSSDNGIAHAAADFALGFWQLREERQIDRAETFLDQMIKHEQQRRDDQNRAHERERLHERVLEIAPTVVWGGHLV
jgi:hypothetical protein